MYASGSVRFCPVDKKPACRPGSLYAGFKNLYSLYPVAGQDQADNHLPEVMIRGTAIPAVRNFMKGYDSVSLIQPCFIAAFCFFGHLCFSFLPARRKRVIALRGSPLRRSDRRWLSDRRCKPGRSGPFLRRRRGIYPGRRQNSCRLSAPSIPPACIRPRR